MDKKLVSLLVFTILLSLFAVVKFNVTIGSRTIFVPSDFPSIQAAINNATDGDTIFVFNGTYYENLVVNKSITLVGQGEEITVIDGGGLGTVVYVTANNVSIGNFTVQNSGFSSPLSGVSVSSNYVSVNESILKSNYVGLRLQNSRGCIVSKCDVLNNHIGVHVETSENSSVERSDITANIEAGICLDDSNSIEIRNNNITGNGLYGVRIQHSQNNAISDNLVSLHENGMTLNTAGNNTLSNNTIESNKYNFGVYGTNLYDFLQNIDVSNTVNDKLVYYLVNKKDAVINSSSNAGYVALVNSSNVHVKDLRLERNRDGLLLAYSHNCKMQQNDLADNLHGVHFYHSQNSVLEGSTIVGNQDGISLISSPGSLIRNNSVVNNGNFGIEIKYSDDSVLLNNNVTLNGEEGFDVYGSLNNTFSGNTVFANGRGIRLQYSDWAKVEDNLIANNTWDGVYIVGSNDCVVQGNTVSANVGYGIRFSYSAVTDVDENTIIDNEANGIYLYKCNVFNFRGNVIVGNVVGIYSYRCFNCTMASNQISNHSREGIEVVYSEYVVVSENTLLRNGRAGVGVYYSTENVVKNNFINRNLDYGVWLDNANNILIVGNNVTCNNWHGIYLHVLNNCTVKNNLIDGNLNGLDFWLADNNTITDNIVEENSCGMHLEDCIHNRIFHNSFSNNTQQVSTLGQCENIWDNDYPSGGNYWSDYSGIDLYKGPFQNSIGSDGIGDTAYVIDSENSDSYPLMVPYRVHDLEVANVSMVSSKIYVGWVVNVSVTVENVGQHVESLNLSVFWNGVTLGTSVVESLHVGEKVVLDYVWNTTGGVPCGSYTVKAEADAVYGEADLENNVRLFEVTVNMVGDVNGDRKVNILDIAEVAIIFGSHKGDADFRLDCDFNRDDLINILDLAAAAKNFGEECTV